MKKIFFLMPLFFGFQAFAQIQPDTQLIIGITTKLQSTPDGNKCRQMLGSLVEVGTKMFLKSGDEIKRIAGHSGGGVVQDPRTKKYTIYINRDLNMNQLTRAICHEVQHVTDEIGMDAYLMMNPQMKTAGERTVAAIKAGTFDSFKASNPKEADYVMKGLFCTELRAYKWSGMLENEDQGLMPPDTGHAKYIYDGYIKTKNYEFKEDINEIAKECLEKTSFVNYIKTFESSVGGYLPIPSTHQPLQGTPSVR